MRIKDRLVGAIAKLGAIALGVGATLAAAPPDAIAFCADNSWCIDESTCQELSHMPDVYCTIACTETTCECTLNMGCC